MENKEYTTKQEQIARFAKAMGHPARIAILNFWPNKIVVFSAIYTKYCLFPKQRYRNI